MTSEILIIGAGICGISLARASKKKVILLEKSKGVGGRIATRRIENLGLDHGALYLNESPALEALISATGFEVKKTKGLYIDGGMTQIPKKLSENLDIRKGVRAKKIERLNPGWKVTSDTGEIFSAEKLVITAPVPQALELLSENKILFPETLNEVTYTKAVMALIVTGSPFVVPKFLPKYIESISEMRLRSLHPNGIVIRATPEFSEEIFDLPDEQNLKTLVETLLRISPTTDITHTELKKWRYVLPKSCFEAPYLEVAPDLFLAGDGFSSPDINGSLAGATALAAKL